ncbi:lytic transglycosylase domain-containing protein [bacterium]|nr:lytic transglycosylase domain-containing protein [bacterium]
MLRGWCQRRPFRIGCVGSGLGWLNLIVLIVGLFPSGLGATPQPDTLSVALHRFIASKNPRLSDENRHTMVTHLITESHAHRIDPTLVAAIIAVESQFNPKASHNGAMGLGQLMGGTARRLGVRDPFSIPDNLSGTIRYTAQAAQRFAQSPHALELTLAAYLLGTVTATHPDRLPLRALRYIEQVKAQQRILRQQLETGP